MRFSPQSQRTGGWSADVGKRKWRGRLLKGELEGEKGRVQGGEESLFCRDETKERRKDPSIDGTRVDIIYCNI
jgi:hypothetical protein